MKKTLLAILTCTLLAGCATQPQSPDNRMFTKEHGVYWHADPQKSVATNAYALAGVPVNVDEAENAGGGVDEGLASKMLLNTATGVITGGLKAGIGMFTASLYSEADAEFLMVPQSVVFISNPRNLPYDDPSLIKEGARIVIESIKEQPKILGATYEGQINALNACTISKSSMGPWDSCELKSKVENSGDVGSEFFKYQVIRPATGDELAQLSLPKGNYSIIRYTNIFSKNATSMTNNFPGFILQPQSKKTAPGFPSVTINNLEYYFIKGDLGKKGFPHKKEI
ncbi:TPA: hypothetical protein NRM86_003508 [Klebsiella pneumoniae]|nr:hypothetical protein [Klebsiella pneumoniae]